MAFSRLKNGLRYSLRAVVVLLAIGIVWFAWHGKRQQDAASTLEQSGWDVFYSCPREPASADADPSSSTATARKLYCNQSFSRLNAMR